MAKKTTTKKKSGPILPDVTVELVGSDGNAMAIMGKVRAAMKKAGHGDRVEKFLEEAMSGDYDNVLQTCMNWVNVE